MKQNKNTKQDQITIYRCFETDYVFHLPRSDTLLINFSVFLRVIYHNAGCQNNLSKHTLNCEISQTGDNRKTSSLFEMAEREGFEPSTGVASTRFPVVLLRPTRTPLLNKKYNIFYRLVKAFIPVYQNFSDKTVSLNQIYVKNLEIESIRFTVVIY